MSHTKGPWIAELLLFNRTDEMRFLLSTPDDEFGHMQLRNTNIYDALDNARVIAAAPDLLEACESAHKAFKEQFGHHTFMGTTMKAFMDMEEAIRKARGQNDLA